MVSLKTTWTYRGCGGEKKEGRKRGKRREKKRRGEGGEERRREGKEICYVLTLFSRCG